MAKEPIAGIYKFTNEINGLSYIGQSQELFIPRRSTQKRPPEFRMEL